MKTLEQLKELASKCLDGRDFNRLAKFIPYNMIKDFGMEPNEEYNNEERWNSTVVEFTRENVLKQLEEDVRFGFEKALNQRGISASWSIKFNGPLYGRTKQSIHLCFGISPLLDVVLVQY